MSADEPFDRHLPRKIHGFGLPRVPYHLAPTSIAYAGPQSVLPFHSPARYNPYMDNVFQRQSPMNVHFNRPCFSSVTPSRSYSISPNGHNILSDKETKAKVEGSLCDPPMLPDRVCVIPEEFLAASLEANMSRFGRFCVEQYVCDPRSDPRTIKICRVISLIQSRINS